MAYKKKTWQEKLEDVKGFPKVIYLEQNFPCRPALEKMGARIGDSVVLAPPLEVYELMGEPPEGTLVTLEQICRQLAQKHQAQYCCTLTTGIFITISANAAEEMGTDLPYWRTIKNNGELNAKYPEGVERQKELLEREGHAFIVKGKKHIRYFVQDYESRLFRII